MPIIIPPPAFIPVEDVLGVLPVPSPVLPELVLPGVPLPPVVELPPLADDPKLDVPPKLLLPLVPNALVAPELPVVAVPFIELDPVMPLPPAGEGVTVFPGNPDSGCPKKLFTVVFASPTWISRQSSLPVNGLRYFCRRKRMLFVFSSWSIDDG